MLKQLILLSNIYRMKWTACYQAFNEADWIEKSIRCIINDVDRIVIVEGCWSNSDDVYGSFRSTDGTIEIIQKLQKEFPYIEMYHENRLTEQRQRDTYLEKLDDGDYVFMCDGDELVIPSQFKDAKRYSTYYLDNGSEQLLFAAYINVYDVDGKLVPVLLNHRRGAFFKFRKDIRHLDDERLKARPGELYMFDDYGKGPLYNKTPMRTIPRDIFQMFHMKYAKNIESLAMREAQYRKVWSGIDELNIENIKEEMRQRIVQGTENQKPYEGELPYDIHKKCNHNI